VSGGDWGAASPEDIKIVLTSVFEALAGDFPRHAADRIVVERSKSGPSVLAQKSGDGAYRVLLDVNDTRWDQFAYQFSHELCHIFTNFEHREVALAAARDHQWFEEAVCEAMALIGLEKVADRWERMPPYPHWRAYAPVFLEYESRLLAQAHRGLLPGVSLAAWFRANRAELERDPYVRSKNEVMASALIVLLRQAPAEVEALGYLNLATPASASDFSEYLEVWSNSCPPRCRTFVARLRSLIEGAGARGA
jgi:hypothetical protein